MSTRTRTDDLCRTPSHTKVLIVPCIVPRKKKKPREWSNGRYIFFEKKRIAEGKPKSAARLRLERAGGWIATRVYVYEIQGKEEECFEDGKGRLFLRRTGKPVKLG